MEDKIKGLEKKALKLRRKIFRSCYRAGGSHIGGALSTVEILTTLYFGGILEYRKEEPSWEDRDRFILSKGHSAVALYSVLAESGIIDELLLNDYCLNGSSLGGHPKMDELDGVEGTTGALGHGALFGLGIALGAKIGKKKFKVFCLLGDGELQEGSIWESAIFAPAHSLSNLVYIIDSNKLQAMDKLENILPMESIAEKWKSFNWQVIECNGHDFGELLDAFYKVENEPEKPAVIIAHTIKGKGISFMESQPLWHFRQPDDKELEIALEELGMTREELL